jgi:hypothetical protein
MNVAVLSRRQISLAAITAVGLLALGIAPPALAVQSSFAVRTSSGAVLPPPAGSELPNCQEVDPQSRALGATDDPSITKIEGGGKKYTYALPDGLGEYMTVSEPPEGFDPLTASGKELQTWGFPPRPTNAAGIEQWKELVGPYREAEYHEGCRQTSEEQDHKYLGETYNGIWSGYEDVAPNNQSKWHGVFGRYYQAVNHGSCKPNANVASWVGLGGDPNYPGGNRFMQAGTETEANGFVFGWIEWWTGAEEIHFSYEPIRSSNGQPFVVEEGNYILMSLYYNYEQETYYVYITNDHTGQTELIQGKIGHQFYDGDTAEWIDEAAGSQPLLNFHEINWYNAQTQNAANEVLPVTAYNYEKDLAGPGSGSKSMWPGTIWNGESWTDFYYHC